MESGPFSLLPRAVFTFQWIDDALSDLHLAPTLDGVLAGHIGTVLLGSDLLCLSSTAPEDGGDCPGIQGAGVYPAVDPVLPAGSVPCRCDQHPRRG